MRRDRKFISTVYSIVDDTVPRFIWVALQLDELAKCSSKAEITKRLKELPTGLDEIYNRILKKIHKMPTSGHSCSGWPFPSVQ